MRRFSMITCLLTSAGLLMPAFATAEEVGTYRPGQTYHSVVASSPMQCASQCQGDAQCKGWNFVRPRQMSRTGVCEFNAQKVTPVPSPSSVSGDNETARTSHNIVSAGTRTVRIGSPVPPAPQYMSAQRPEPTHMLPQSVQTSTPNIAPRTMSAPLTASRQAPSPAVNTAARPDTQAKQTAMQQSRPVRIEHNLDGPDYRPQNAAPRFKRRGLKPNMQAALAGAKPAPTAPRPMPVAPQMRIQHHLDEGTSAASYQAQIQAKPQARLNPPQPRPQMQHSQAAPSPRAPVIMRHHLDDTGQRYDAARQTPPQIDRMAPQHQNQQAYAAPYQAQPQQTQQHARPMTPQTRPAAAQSSPQITLYPHPIAPARSAQAPSSLYGSLYDDVQAGRVTAPLALTQQNTPNDPNVPIPTVRYIQTQPVSTAALPTPYGR